MPHNRRNFIRLSGLTGLGLSSPGWMQEFSAENLNVSPFQQLSMPEPVLQSSTSLIGGYGQWAASLTEKSLPSFSFRNKKWQDLKTWKKAARDRAIERLAIPDIGGMPVVKVISTSEYDGLHIEELSWQLPYGNPTAAILLRPKDVSKKLPGILAFHDHGGNKYFGTRKITKTSDHQHPLMVEHQELYYQNRAWANEIAKKGYVVLVSDAFPFGSRRVMLSDVPERYRDGLSDENPEDAKNIEAYNQWAGNHEHIMAKSLFSAGTTWPGVFFAEDRKALDILCARPEVDAGRIGCAGLSGGGMRTIFMGGLDPRIKCAICVGFMSTWKDFILNKSVTHTWMTYVPLLPNEMDLPEILGLRVPLPTMILNDSDDDLYTLPEMKRADGILAEVYKKAGAADRYKCSYYPGPHKFDLPMQLEAFDWFEKWLK